MLLTHRLVGTLQLYDTVAPFDGRAVGIKTSDAGDLDKLQAGVHAAHSPIIVRSSERAVSSTDSIGHVVAHVLVRKLHEVPELNGHSMLHLAAKLRITTKSQPGSALFWTDDRMTSCWLSRIRVRCAFAEAGKGSRQRRAYGGMSSVPHTSIMMKGEGSSAEQDSLLSLFLPQSVRAPRRHRMRKDTSQN